MEEEESKVERPTGGLGKLDIATTNETTTASGFQPVEAPHPETPPPPT